MTVLTRPAAPADEASLKKIWKACFHDGDRDIDAFFRALYAPENTVVSEDGVVTGAAYLLPLGDFIPAEGGRIPCAVTYALGVSPGGRRHGAGAALAIRAAELAEERGWLPLICPAEPSLFGYYERHGGYRDAFYAEETTFPAAAADGASVLPVDTAEYLRLRESLLSGRPHISFSPRMMEYQATLSAGAGLFKIATEAGLCLAAAEPGDVPFAKEFLGPENAIPAAAAALAAELGAGSLRARYPAKNGGAPFAMAAGREEIFSGRPWFGFAFD